MIEQAARLFLENYATPLLADSAFRAGLEFSVAPPGLSPLENNMRLAGPVFTVQARNDLVSILAAVHQAQSGHVLVISNPGSEAAVIGDLIGTEAIRKRLGGMVVDGMVRDSNELVEMGLPVFCRGTYPIAPLKLADSQTGLGEPGVPLDLGGCDVRTADWVFGDADGLLFISPDNLEVLFKEAALALEREAALLRLVHDGTPLGDLLGLEAFLRKRSTDPTADFNEHLRQAGRAI